MWSTEFGFPYMPFLAFSSPAVLTMPCFPVSRFQSPSLLHRLWDIARYWSKIAVLTYPTSISRPRRGWPRWNFAEISGIRKLEGLPYFMWYKDIAGRFSGLVTTKHACDRQTDRRTDGQNYDSQDRASIAASRGKNVIASIALCARALSCWKMRNPLEI